MLEFRDLRADEIEVRVAQARQNGASLLLYKDARCDMRILDETLGPLAWQKKFYEHKGTLFCSVGINVGGEWVWKDDAGEPSNTSAQKGEASDAFKRACFNWDIGRELYTAPFIWVPREKLAKLQTDGGKVKCYDRFHVEKIRIENGVITGLSIWNETAKCRAFTWVKQGEQQKLTDAGR